jgi:endonuclease/exonuclease/phosphatase family metal-dependent hydrolase
MHALFWGTGGGTAERIQELRAIAAWLDEWRHSRHAWDRHLIALGDFQIDRLDSPVHQAFTATGLRMPDGLQNVPRTIFDDPDHPTKMYSQIAWFDGDDDAPSLPIRYLRGGTFDFTGVALQSRELSKRELSYLISDHFPLWAEFSLRG